MGKAYEKEVKVERGIRWLQKREQDYANMDKISRCGMWNVAPLKRLARINRAAFINEHTSIVPMPDNSG